MNRPSNQVVQEVPEEAVEALRLELVGEGWDDANARARTGKRPGSKPTEDEMLAARREISDELRTALAAAYPAIRKEIESKVRAEVEAECNEQAADFSTELEDIAAAIRPGFGVDYEAIYESLNRIACELAALQPTKLATALEQVGAEEGERLLYIAANLEGQLGADPDGSDGLDKDVAAIREIGKALRGGGASPAEAAKEFIRRAGLLEGLSSPENAGAIAYREAAAFLSDTQEVHGG